MLSRVDHHCCREGEGGLGPPKLKLEIILIQDKFFFGILFFAYLRMFLPLTCKASLLEALRKTLGKSFVPGSILNRCLISLPSQVKLPEKRNEVFRFEARH